MARALCREERFALGIFGGKAVYQVGTDLVIGLPDHRPQRRVNAFARRAELFHRRDRGLDDAKQRATPAGMDGADHPVLLVDEVLGFRRFADAEFTGDVPSTIVRCERYVAGSFRRGSEQWPVLGLRTLLEDPAFAEASA